MDKDEIHLVAEDSSAAASRKQDHIDMAFESAKSAAIRDERFFYEPILHGHARSYPETTFLGFNMKLPIWISSMTGGTEKANLINHNLAKACGKYGMGMGLGSCRSLLYEDTYLKDFDVKRWMPDQPLFANLGIAQIEELIVNKQLTQVDLLLDKLNADGLIIHVNPLQEWLQAEGDFIHSPPIESIKKVLNHASYPIIVKEVGQGMGKKSLKALMELPLAAIEFGAFGGTNFSTLELMRNKDAASLMPLCHVGHTATEMIEFVNQLKSEGSANETMSFIVSGGIPNFLDGYYCLQKIQYRAVYGQASAMLKYALQGYEPLCHFIEKQKEGLALANAFLSIKEHE